LEFVMSIFIDLLRLHHEALERQQTKLLPVHYFMVTFTFPYELRPLARRQPKALYQTMFSVGITIKHDTNGIKAKVITCLTPLRWLKSGEQECSMPSILTQIYFCQKPEHYQRYNFSG